MYAFNVVSTTNIDSYPIGRSTIDLLSDDVLLYIFDSYRQVVKHDEGTWPWRLLVSVCQRWRHIILKWPHHLNLLLDCKSRSAVEKAQDVWPAFPMFIRSRYSGDHVISALKHRDRVVGIHFSLLSRRQLEICASLMEEPFPALRTLFLRCCTKDSDAPVITDAFLGGSAPCLQRIELWRVPFPTLPNLLLSASNLVHLHLEDITNIGYISPDVMATCLAMLTRLQYVDISFSSKKSFPDQTNRCPPPPARAVLPAITTFMFEGISEYLEDLMARIDVPLLDHLVLHLFYQPIIDMRQLPQLICRTEKFELKPPVEAKVVFLHNDVDIFLLPSESVYSYLLFRLVGARSEEQLSWLAQICTQCLALLSCVHKLMLNPVYFAPPPPQDWQDLMPWLGFLRPFNSVRILHVHELEVLIARLLGELTGERATQVLPMLHTLVLESDQSEALLTRILKPFIDARRLLDHPVKVHWRKPDNR